MTTTAMAARRKPAVVARLQMDGTPRSAFVNQTFELRLFLKSASTGTAHKAQHVQVDCSLLWENNMPVAHAERMLSVAPTDGQSKLIFRGASSLNVRLAFTDAACSQAQGRKFKLRFSSQDPSIAPLETPPVHIVRTRIQLTTQQPDIFYKDEGGCDKQFSVTVQLGDYQGRQVRTRVVPMRVSLEYESGEIVSKQRVLKQITGNAEIRNGAATVELRLDDVSKNHQKQKFCVRFSPANIPELYDVADAITTPILVKSKRPVAKKKVNGAQRKAVGGAAPVSSLASLPPLQQVVQWCTWVSDNLRNMQTFIGQSLQVYEDVAQGLQALQKRDHQAQQFFPRVQQQTPTAAGMAPAQPTSSSSPLSPSSSSSSSSSSSNKRKVPSNIGTATIVKPENSLPPSSSTAASAFRNNLAPDPMIRQPSIPGIPQAPQLSLGISGLPHGFGGIGDLQRMPSFGGPGGLLWQQSIPSILPQSSIPSMLMQASASSMLDVFGKEQMDNLDQFGLAPNAKRQKMADDCVAAVLGILLKLIPPAGRTRTARVQQELGFMAFNDEEELVGFYQLDESANSGANLSFLPLSSFDARTRDAALPVAKASYERAKKTMIQDGDSSQLVTKINYVSLDRVKEEAFLRYFKSKAQSSPGDHPDFITC